MTRPRLPRRGALALLSCVVLSACAGLGQPVYTPHTLEGRVLPADPSAPLAAGSHVSVRLLDVGRAGAPSTVLAEQIVESPRAFPVRFSLCYDRAALQGDGRYALDARVFVDGELRMIGERALADPAADPPPHPDVVVTALPR
ncbi:YbaY family lipoprotein [Crenobacter luteus]|uniref:Lipoprotein n=1 Tax=Crenobacter luteus TaxID=1452487 RepID=A0A163CU59_9NEIS|nr:YbaY family lipoprotein [Crenobacter luteus]KZE33177.1 hypothetical protein AVW16_09245 [Crenobacter luteus]